MKTNKKRVLGEGAFSRGLHVQRTIRDNEPDLLREPPTYSKRKTFYERYHVKDYRHWVDRVRRI